MMRKHVEWLRQSARSAPSDNWGQQECFYLSKSLFSTVKHWVNTTLTVFVKSVSVGPLVCQQAYSQNLMSVNWYLLV